MFIKWLQNGGSNSNITELPPVPAPESTLPKEIAEPEVPLKRGNYYYSKYDGSLNIPGLSNEDSRIRNGNWLMYEKGAFTDPRYKWLKNRNTGEYFKYEPEKNPTLNLSDYDEVSTDELMSVLPKKKYIGGEGYRLATVKRVPGLLDMIKNKAMSYGLNPNLLLHRFMKEGIVDQWVNTYNNMIDASEQPNYFNTVMNQSVSGYGELGLDDAGSNLLQGKYTLKDPTAKWETSDLTKFTNEEGRKIASITTPDLNSALEIKAAEMAFRQRELAKMGLTGDAYINGAYNMGLHNSKLNDPDYVSRNYSVPDYGVFKKGGILSAKSGIHIKKANRGKFTDYCGGKVTSACIAKGKASSNPTIRKRATFAANARKWKHQNGGKIMPYWVHDILGGE